MNGREKHDYKKLMDKLLTLPSCTLLATGRTGSCFLQSLLDSHPEVLTFNGPLHYHAFWRSSVCVNAGKFDLSDFMDEFIGKHIEKLKSKYELIERKDQLGEDRNQSINIELGKFKSEVMDLLSEQEVNSKNSILAIYAAYAMCLGQDIEKKTLFFHHEHNVETLDRYLSDFPDSKIICMTRDPRANFVSGIEHWRRYDPTKDRGSHLYRYLERLLADASVLENYDNPHIIIRIEDLNQEYILKKLAKWLNISYDDSLKKSTWGGLLWHGDRLSVKKIEGGGLSRNILNNDWEKRLSYLDKYVFNYIMYKRIEHYRYSYNKISIFDTLIVPFLILFPLKYELRFFSFTYICKSLQNREYRKIASNFFHYIKRICLLFRYYSKVLGRVNFNYRFLN